LNFLFFFSLFCNFYSQRFRLLLLHYLAALFGRIIHRPHEEEEEEEEEEAIVVEY